MIVDFKDQDTEAAPVALPRRRPAAPATVVETAEAPRRRALAAGPLVALVTMVSALVLTSAAGVPLRDPDHVAGRRLLLVLWLVAALVALDIVVRASRRSRGILPSPSALLAVRRERWTARRGVAVGSALISFYVTYLAYRNLKSVVPLLRPGELFDRQLAAIDRGLFFGHDPAALLHSLLGTELATPFFSGAYMLFFAFVPGTLAFALVFSPNLQAGLFYATAQSVNWLLGAVSYFVLPTLGPVYADPDDFTRLPASEATHLQSVLLDQRLDFLSDPVAGTAQSIAAFCSLHVSIFFTAALAVQLLRLARPVRIAAWAAFGVTVLSTIYLGWHYVVDDVGGLVIGVAAILLARGLTGFKLPTPKRTPA
jgi:hypothetical protein